MSVFRQAALAAALAAATLGAQAQVRITEWMYNGSEFIEFTNLGTTAVDMTGWSFDDDSRSAGTVSLSAFGTLAAGQSAVLAEVDAASFRAEWNLGEGVAVIGNNGANLGRSDEINLYDASNALADRLTYSDQTIAGTIRTQNVSGNPLSLAMLAGDDSTGWVLSSVGDSFGSRLSAGGFVGNPGFSALAVPEPGTWALMLAGLAGVGLLRRRAR